MALAQQGEGGQHEGLGQGIGGGDAHLAAQALIAGARLAFDGLDGLLHGAGIRQHGLAEGAEIIELGGADKELGAEVLLQCRDAAPHGGLIDPQYAGGAAQGALPCQCQKKPRVVPVDHRASHSKVPRRGVPIRSQCRRDHKARVPFSTCR